MLKLRPYQEEAVRKAIDYFITGGEPSLIVLPTAWGKSILTAFVAASIDYDDKLLVVQPTKELLEQNFNKFQNLCGEDAKDQAGIFSASFGKKEIKKITYAAIGSIKELGVKFKELGYTKMLIDEAHLYPRKEQSMLGGFLLDSGISTVLGITATPLKLEQFSINAGDRFDKWSELIMLTDLAPSGRFFKKILHVGQIQEMLQMKYWSPLKYERLPFNPGDLRLNSTGSDYSEDSEELAYKLNNIRDNIYAALNYHSERKHCMVFVTSVEEAAILADNYPNAAVVFGNMNKKDRTNIIENFRNGKIRVLFNVNVLGTGFDYPEIDMIIMGFATASVAKYYQILGRGVRIHPDKKDCLIVDMGGNIDKFGFVEEISFRQHCGKWRMFGTQDRILTGVPIACSGKINGNDIYDISTRNYSGYSLNYGKYKGIPLESVPMGYKIWTLNNRRDADMNTDEKRALIWNMENYVRDTTNEPPMTLMPDGQHAGEELWMVPKGYLAWYYNNVVWNETNDSLRRGIEFAYGGIPRWKTTKR